MEFETETRQPWMDNLDRDMVRDKTVMEGLRKLSIDKYPDVWDKKVVHKTPKG